MKAADVAKAGFQSVQRVIEQELAGLLGEAGNGKLGFD